MSPRSLNQDYLPQALHASEKLLLRKESHLGRAQAVGQEQHVNRVHSRSNVVAKAFDALRSDLADEKGGGSAIKGIGTV